MKIKIISDGTARGTKVVNAETGEPVENVCTIKWGITATNGVAIASIGFIEVSVEVVGEVKENG